MTSQSRTKLPYVCSSSGLGVSPLFSKINTRYLDFGYICVSSRMLRILGASKIKTRYVDFVSGCPTARLGDQSSLRGLRAFFTGVGDAGDSQILFVKGLSNAKNFEGVSRCCDDSCSKVSGFFQQLFSFTLAFKAAVHNRSAAINPVTNACSLKSSHAKPRLELQANAESLDREPLNRHPKCSVESACRQLCIGWRMAYDPLAVAP